MIDRLTDVQRELLAFLADGEPHSVEDLTACLKGGAGRNVTVRVHLSGMRKRIREFGLGVMCEEGRYTLVPVAPFRECSEVSLSSVQEVRRILMENVYGHFNQCRAVCGNALCVELTHLRFIL